MSVVCLPLLCVAWAAALLLGSEAGARRDALSAALAAAVALHAAAAALGHTALNVRVRDNLKRSVRAGPRAAGSEAGATYILPIHELRLLHWRLPISL